MIGIVIVSHSARLAEGVLELARGMGGADLRIQAAGGLALPGQPLGTDPAAVLAAIEAVYSEEGVLVLMDLGSALLSAEMAVEMLPPEKQAKVILCEAPLVEGAVAAAVQARLGNSLEQALAEARGALSAKAGHLGISTPPLSPGQAHPAVPDADQALELRMEVHNPLGLHARPAARLVQTAGRFKPARIMVSNLTTGRGPASAASINALAALGIRQGHTILVTAAGPHAEAALSAIQALAAENFGDQEAVEAPVPQTPQAEHTLQKAAPPGFLQGLPVSPGMAAGPAHRFRPAAPEIPTHLTSDPQAEWKRLLAALERTRAQIQADRDAAVRRVGAGTASILDAHLLYLEDDALREPARTAIFDEKLNAAAAWQGSFERAAASYRALEDPYLQGRAADVEEVGRQVLTNLLGNSGAGWAFSEAGILLAANLALADAARLDPALTPGICLAYGSPTSHSAIMARSLGIPAIAGLGEDILKLADGTPLVMDGEQGRVWPNPEPALMADYTRWSQARQAARAAEQVAAAALAVTRDGRRVEVAANIASVAEARAAVARGAEGVGVFRTEFLFLNRPAAPDEEEQYRAYRVAAEALGGRSLIIRTLDAGGDKPIPYLNLEVEANPFLGLRAIRLCLAHPDLFKTQLRAILRTAAEFPVKVMFPMIATLEEWREASALLDEARGEVQRQGLASLPEIETGIMIEIPSAALCAAQFAGEVDFFSIGTNDLTQYTLAAERGNPSLAVLADAFHPAVLKLIYQVAEAAHTRGKWAGVCGEMAGDPLAVPVLVGLGIDELSMNPPSIPRAKEIIRTLDYTSLQGRARDLLHLDSAQAVRQAAGSLLSG
jgi:phosphoenolpyruvate-protein phosphotransferase/dihydroxyacetone kinase phosphotransfer subunit